MYARLLVCSILGGFFALATNLEAQPPPVGAVLPAGNVECSATWGTIQYGPKLWTGGFSLFHVKITGKFANCDNLLNPGDPIIGGYFTATGYHPAPNTCANAVTPGYVINNMKVNWTAVAVAAIGAPAYPLVTKAKLTTFSAPYPDFHTTWTGVPLSAANALNVTPLHLDAYNFPTAPPCPTSPGLGLAGFLASTTLLGGFGF